MDIRKFFAKTVINLENSRHLTLASLPYPWTDKGAARSRGTHLGRGEHTGHVSLLPVSLRGAPEDTESASKKSHSAYDIFHKWRNLTLRRQNFALRRCHTGLCSHQVALQSSSRPQKIKYRPQKVAYCHLRSVHRPPTANVTQEKNAPQESLCHGRTWSALGTYLPGRIPPGQLRKRPRKHHSRAEARGPVLNVLNARRPGCHI